MPARLIYANGVGEQLGTSYVDAIHDYREFFGLIDS
jgi:hypothetical protein